MLYSAAQNNILSHSLPTKGVLITFHFIIISFIWYQRLRYYKLGDFFLLFRVFKNFSHIHTTCDAATAALCQQYIIFTHNFHYFGLLSKRGAGVEINESEENGKILMKPSTFLTHTILFYPWVRMRIKLSVEDVKFFITFCGLQCDRI